MFMVIAKRLFFVIMVMILLAGCAQPAISTPAPSSAVPGQPTTTITPGGKPTPVDQVTRAPNAQDAAHVFLDAWKGSQYQAMYDMLTLLSKDAQKNTDFIKYYQDAETNLTLKSLDYDILSSLTNLNDAQVRYSVTFHTNLFGDIKRETMMNFSLVQGQWRVAWDESMIMPELKGGNKLALDVTAPPRGNILDRNGSALAAESDSVALGYIPQQIPTGSASTLIGVLSQLLDKPASLLSKELEYAWQTPAQYMPVGEVPLQDVQRYYPQLQASGAIMENYKSRFYFDGGVAAQIIGYTLFISEDQKQAYLRQGYNGSEKVGSAGLEKWGEQYLIGQRGAKLYVVDGNGQPITLLGQVNGKPSASIYTTFDKDFQERVERSLRGFTGSVVVLQRDTGRILAMASAPTFDPNLFDPSNNNSRFQLGDLLNDQNKPMLNRAAQSSYPPGSVFKIVTLAAALESGLYDPATFKFDCTSDFTELPGVTLYDWTHWKDLLPSGMVTFRQGLMRSCDPLFYHLGLDMFRKNMPKAVSDMARAFGMGSASGVNQIAEDSGSIPDPQNEGDAVQLAFGQGENLVTPLQMADYIAAVGNGGTLYRSQIVEKIMQPDGETLEQFKPEERGKLPVKPENLKLIQDAMHDVIADPKGTAHRPFLGLNVPLYGKTGTATNSQDIEHAWFGGYTNVGDGNDIAVVVMCENAGEGSAIAAPIFRRVIEYYMYGKASTLYPWESSFFITRTPTLTPETPTPGPSPTAPVQ
jgi:penicillin-binding protein 2